MVTYSPVCVCMCVCSAMLAGWDYACRVTLRWCVTAKQKCFNHHRAAVFVFFCIRPLINSWPGHLPKKKIQFVLQQRQNKFCLWEDRGLRGKEKCGLLSEGDDGDKKEEKLTRGKIKTRKNTRERWQKYVLEEQKHIKETYTPITGRLPVTKLPGNRRSVYLWWWGEKVEEGEEEKRRAIGRCVTGR